MSSQERLTDPDRYAQIAERHAQRLRNDPGFMHTPSREINELRGLGVFLDSGVAHGDYVRAKLTAHGYKTEAEGDLIVQTNEHGDPVKLSIKNKIERLRFRALDSIEKISRPASVVHDAPVKLPRNSQ